MSEAATRLLDYGVLGLILVLGITGLGWFIRYVLKQLFSRDPQTEGLAVSWVKSSNELHRDMKKFMDSLSERDERQEVAQAVQQGLCVRHVESQEKISELLTVHDKYATERTTGIKELIAMHTDAAIPNSTAQAIHNVAQLKLAAMTACNGCREAAEGMEEPIKDVVVRHCEEIEKILKTTV